MPSSIYALFRDALRARKQVLCVYHGRRRELCPHIIGLDKDGREAVLAWQFGGESSGSLPQWRCLKLAGVSNAHARTGAWHTGRHHRTTQTCVTAIDIDVNVHVHPKSMRVSQSRSA
ncbi:MAG TPA: hypothetical protein VHC94_06695 [Nitrobacter sp.]|nr:hypothetical protein [Nitrobacter sp.]